MPGIASVSFLSAQERPLSKHFNLSSVKVSSCEDVLSLETLAVLLFLPFPEVRITWLFVVVVVVVVFLCQ